MSEKADYGNHSHLKEQPGPESSVPETAELKNYGPFAEYIRELRDSHGYSQKQVADYLDLTPAAYGYYERGDRNPTPAMIAALSMLYNVNALTLLIYAVNAEKPSILQDIVQDVEEYAPGCSSLPPAAPGAASRVTVSAAERKLLKHYRAQSPPVKKYIDKLVKNP